MWTIQLLGGLAARRSQQEVTRFRTQKSAALLAYLAFHAAPHSLPQPRDVLIEMLWPETGPSTAPVAPLSLTHRGQVRSLLQPVR